jgi:hypothetical protein
MISLVRKPSLKYVYSTYIQQVLWKNDLNIWNDVSLFIAAIDVVNGIPFGQAFTQFCDIELLAVLHIGVPLFCVLIDKIALVISFELINT